MSNWYNSEIEISGPSEQVEKALKFIINDEQEVDFSLAAPLPIGVEHTPAVIFNTWGVNSIAFHTRKLDASKFYFATKNHWPREWLIKLGAKLIDEDIHATINLITAEGGAMIGHDYTMDSWGILSGREMDHDEICEFLAIEDDEDE